MLLRLFLIAAIATAAASAAATAPDGITVEGMLEPGTGVRRRYMCPARFVRMGNSCYFLSSTMASWHDAHFECRARSAQLTALEKRWEDRNMRHYLQREELAPLARWVGGIYQPRMRRWVWGGSGMHIAYKSFPRRAVSRDLSWHCLALDPAVRYKWRASSCLELKHYICEAPLRLHRAPAPGRHGGWLRGHRREDGVGAGAGARRGAGRRTGGAGQRAAVRGVATVHRRPHGPHVSWHRRERPRSSTSTTPCPPQIIDISLETHRPPHHRRHRHSTTAPSPLLHRNRPYRVHFKSLPDDNNDLPNDVITKFN